MKILHIYKDYFPVVGGIENHIQALAEAQAARGHSVSVLVNSRDRHTWEENRNGVRVIFAARWLTLSSAPVGLALPQHVARVTPDVAHLHFPYPWGELAQYLFGRARCTVLTYHSDIIRQKYSRVLYGPLMWRILGRVDRIIATSPHYVRSSAILQRLAENCTIIPLAIDAVRFEASHSLLAAEIRARLGNGSSAKAPLLLFVGHLRYYKGLDYLLRALPELPGVRLLVAGTGPMLEPWQSLAQELGIHDRVHFAGEVSDADLPSYYATSDIFVLPSSERSEAFGLVQLEAMASGKPVVCTKLGTGTDYVNLDGETGLVVPARDSHALACAIDRLSHDPELRARMGATGRARVLREFTLDKMVDRIMDLYMGLIGKQEAAS